MNSMTSKNLSRYSLPIKAGMFVVWPLVGVSLLVFTAGLFLVSWVLIPFATITDKEGGGIDATFPWGTSDGDSNQ